MTLIKNYLIGLIMASVLPIFLPPFGYGKGFWISLIIIIILGFLLDKYKGEIIKTLISCLLILHSILILTILWWKTLSEDLAGAGVALIFYPFYIGLIIFLSLGSLNLYKAGLLLIKNEPESIYLANLSLLWLLYPSYIILYELYEPSLLPRASIQIFSQIIITVYFYLLFGGLYSSHLFIKDYISKNRITQISQTAFSYFISIVAFVGKKMVIPFLFCILISLFISLLLFSLFFIRAPITDIQIFLLGQYMILFSIISGFIQSTWKILRKNHTSNVKSQL